MCAAFIRCPGRELRSVGFVGLLLYRTLLDAYICGRLMTVPNPATYVQPIHFEDFSGPQFERLVFAYHVRAQRWASLEWYGEAGSDLGRDIWGVTEDGETVCIQCVNRASLTSAKISDDLSKVLRAPNGVPKRFRIVARETVSALKRDKIKAYVHASGVMHCDIWSGSEFEEFLRYRAESLLKRFMNGEPFPDSEPELAAFALDSGPRDLNEITSLTTDAAFCIVEAYKANIQGFTGGKLPPLKDDPESSDRGRALIDLLLLPANRFLIGPSGTTKTFHLRHLAVALINGNREIPIFIDAKGYPGNDFWSHLRRCAAPLLRDDLNVLLKAIAVCGLRPVLLLDAVNECPSGHLDSLLSGAQEFVLQCNARLVGTSQTVPNLVGKLRSDIVEMSLPRDREKEAIYAYHAGLAIGDDVSYLSAPFTNAYDLKIAGLCHSSQSTTPTRADLYDRYIRRSIPDNTAVISALLRNIAGEMSASLSLVMRRNQFSRKAEQFLLDQQIGLSALDDLTRCRLLNVSEDLVSFEHELLFDYFRAEHLLRHFPTPSVLCKELQRPRNQGLFELILPRFSEWGDVEQILLSTSSVDSLRRVMEGRCGASAQRVLERQCSVLLVAAQQDLTNITVKCESVILEDGKRRFVQVQIEGNREWNRYERHLCAVIAHNFARPEIRLRFLSLFDATERTLKEGAYLAARTSRFKPGPVWAKTVRTYSGIVNWGEMKLPCTTILSEIRNSRTASLYPRGVLPIDDELLSRALSDECSHFALHTLNRGWHEGGGGSDIDVKLTLAERGIDSGIGIIQLDSIYLLQSIRPEMKDATEAQMQCARGLLERFVPNDIMLNSLRLEVLASYGGLELIVSVEEAIAEMRALISADQPPAQLLEWAQMERADVGQLRREWACGCLSKIFEDVFQGVYWDAYQALNDPDKVEILCLAGMAERTGFLSDWVISELHKFEGEGIVTVYAYWAKGIDAEALSPQEAVVTYMLAIQGWAKSQSLPPTYREPISSDDKAWNLVGELLFWHFRRGDVEASTERAEEIWRRLADDVPNAVPDVFYQISDSHWHVRSEPFSIRLDLLHPDKARPLLESAIQHRTSLTSIFERGGFRDQGLMLYVLSTLGKIGNLQTAGIVTGLVEDPVLGKHAIAAIAAIRSRMERS
ncbi:hypothetical protein ACPOL_6784 (plasmid) [Acidisarcina polymorpha]|uniref:Uncharacterized protein n=1 Tax=Acidisarcina polymorpha TaxID=2211140 RepID=A0A2Z5GBB0_9BACT|nr:hypothetical protein [Acidisarcina polymorpha]AXC15994.1 hypothetical protein ACPOL_6784 [Acidisarcina polymorpha]